MNGNTQESCTKLGSAVNPSKPTLSNPGPVACEDQCSGFASALFITPPELDNYEDGQQHNSPGVSIAAFNTESYTTFAS